METFRSNISNKEFPIAERVSGSSVRKSLLKKIQQEHKEFTADMNLSVSELNEYRQRYIADVVTRGNGVLSEQEKVVVNSLTEETTLAGILEEDDKEALSFGNRMADAVASFGGSWAFIIFFLFVIVVWIGINTVVFMNRGFDPYPFILLNLLLSCIAALQAPVIMMSQNRQEDKDRSRAKKDYMVNLKSELEIRVLHKKIDHLTQLIEQKK